MYQEAEGKWAYLAALIDGEGCISITRRIKEGEKLTRIHKTRANTHPYKMFTMRVTITNTNLQIMKWLIFNFGGVYYQKRPANEKHKAGYEWRPRGRSNVKTMLTNILPWMVIKPEQVKNALKYIEMTINGERNPDKREQQPNLGRKSTLSALSYCAQRTKNPMFVSVFCHHCRTFTHRCVYFRTRNEQ